VAAWLNKNVRAIQTNEKTIQLFLLFFAPTRLLEKLVAEELKNSSPEKEGHIRDREKGRIEKIRKSLYKSFVVILAIGIVSYICGYILNTFTTVTGTMVLSIRVVSTLLIAWAVFSKLTKEIESWGGRSIPEQVNSYSFRFFYFIGVAGVVCSLYLKPVVAIVP
jgi:cytochrome c biogenesis protein CcdA